MTRSGITQDELVQWGGAEVFNQALAIVNSGDVTSAEYDDDKLEISGKIAQSSGWEMPVKFHLEPGGRIKSACPCMQNQKYGQICPHVVAIGIAIMVKEMDDIEEEEREAKASASDEAPPVQEEEFIEVPMAPKFDAYVSGSRASLSIEIDAYYGDIGLPACSVQSDRVVWLEDEDDPLVRKVRSPKAEQDAIKLVEGYGFERGYRTGDLKLYVTDPQKVLNFLGAGLPRLRRNGWRVELSEKLMALTDTMPSVVPVVQIRDAGSNAFEVKYSFDAMGTEVSPVEIQAAINRGDGYILKDGRVTLLDNSAIEEMHDIFRDCATAGSGTRDGWFRVAGIHAPYVKASLDLLDTIDLDDTAAAKWRETAAARNRSGGAKFEPVSLGRLDGVLRPYQKQGVYWMRFLENAGLCGLLADEMGLGKTLQTLAWLSLPRTGQSGSAKSPALIVCPTSLVRNWESEAQKFTPWTKTLVISGPDRANDFAKIPSADLVITSYALLQRDFEEAYLDKSFSALVLDEAQHIKNRQTRNAKAAKRLDARQRLVLTGTPIENSVADVWSIFDFLMPGYLGDYESFKTGYELPIGEGGAAGEAVQMKLKRKLHPFILRRLKKSVAKDLPDKMVKVSYCPMPEDVQRDYNAVLQKGRRSAKTKFEMLALLMKLRQIASRGKVEAFLDLLDEAIGGGHRVLVFSQFVKQLAVLRDALDKLGIPCCYLDGSTKDRLGECNRFNRNPDIPVFLISLMAGGTGLNLTGADMVIHYDPWWNPAVEDQATDRAHRIGQKKNVYVVKLIASGSIEEKVLALQRRKQALIAATVSTTDAAIVEKLSTEDLAELLG
ncbi:MAG: SNF2 helicase associated domain-containing protein [Kiritimatiellae bacterium]|nr:SNF2 helicase associated domain-containing protein [Kiritimatiellia bacterium]